MPQEQREWRASEGLEGKECAAELGARLHVDLLSNGANAFLDNELVVSTQSAQNLITQDSRGL